MPVKVTESDLRVLEKIGKERRRAMLFHWTDDEEEMMRLRNPEITERLKILSPLQVAQHMIRSFLTGFRAGPPLTIEYWTPDASGEDAYVLHTAFADDAYLQRVKSGLLESAKMLKATRDFEKVEDDPLKIKLTRVQAAALQALADKMTLTPSELGRLIVQESVLYFGLWAKRKEERVRFSDFWMKLKERRVPVFASASVE